MSNCVTKYDWSDIKQLETVLAADTGTVTVREFSDDGRICLGLHRENRPNSPPEISIVLTKRQRKTLSDLLK